MSWVKTILKVSPAFQKRSVTFSHYETEIEELCSMESRTTAPWFDRTKKLTLNYIKQNFPSMLFSAETL